MGSFELWGILQGLRVLGGRVYGVGVSGLGLELLGLGGAVCTGRSKGLRRLLC